MSESNQPKGEPITLPPLPSREEVPPWITGTRGNPDLYSALQVRKMLAADREHLAVAAPVAWMDGEPPFPQNQEWFIAETIYGDRVVLTALPEEYSYDYKTADQTYMKAENIKRWMQFPDCEYLPPAPATVAVASEPVASSILQEIEYAAVHGWPTSTLKRLENMAVAERSRTTAAPLGVPAEASAWTHRLNMLESCANWLESRSRCITLNIKADPEEGGGYENLMRKYAEDLRAIRAVLASETAPAVPAEAVPVDEANGDASATFDDWWYGHDGVRQRQVAYLGWPCTKELAESIWNGAREQAPSPLMVALQQAREALVYHQDQTRPIDKTTDAINAIDTALAAKHDTAPQALKAWDAPETVSEDARKAARYEWLRNTLRTPDEFLIRKTSDGNYWLTGVAMDRAIDAAMSAAGDADALVKGEPGIAAASGDVAADPFLQTR